MKKGMKKEQSGITKFFSVFFLILIIIIGIISILTSFTGFSLGKVTFGILYLILGIFCFLPRKIIKFPNWVRFVIAVVASFVLIIMSISLNWNLSTPESTFNHNMQESFIFNGAVSNISVKVHNITKEKVIILNSIEKKTEGYFLVINCEFTNLGESTLTLNPNYYIMDNQNKSYAGMIFSGYQEYFQPDLKKQAYFILELPNSSEGLNFYLKDSIGIHIISLGI
jgi:hypothetical protein